MATDPIHPAEKAISTTAEPEIAEQRDASPEVAEERDDKPILGETRDEQLVPGEERDEHHLVDSLFAISGTDPQGS